MTLIEPVDFVVRFFPSPMGKIHAMVCMDEDGRANVYLNPALKFQVNKIINVVRHELSHVANNDFARHDIEEIEAHPALVKLIPMGDYIIAVSSSEGGESYGSFD